MPVEGAPGGGLEVAVGVFPASCANAAVPLADRLRGLTSSAYGLVKFEAELRLAVGRVIGRALVEGRQPVQELQRCEVELRFPIGQGFGQAVNQGYLFLGPR